MKKILVLLLIILCSVSTAFAAKIPEDVQTVIKKTFPTADIRFDGVIILQDGTVYLPLYPAKILTPEKLEVQTTYPDKTPINKYPEVIIFNNDFSLLKVINNSDGTKTIRKFDKPPVVIKSGLLPQDMLIPKNLIIPENLKSIAGNLNIKIAPKEEIKVLPTKIEYDKPLTSTKNVKNLVSSITQLNDKVLYISTTYSKDIQVVKGEAKAPEYALSQKSIPCDIAITPDSKFLLVTTYNSTLVDIISLADDKIIKQLDLTTIGGEIIIDSKNNIAYVTSPEASTIYQIALTDMTLKKKIKVNGRCERLALYDKYLLYVDKLTNKIWSIELDNEYTLKDMGIYPNISKLVYDNGKIYLTSRTKNRVAVLDYQNQTLLAEFETIQKPVDMLIHGKHLYILGATDNVIQVLDKESNEPICIIELGTNGFSTKICPIQDTNLIVITDAVSGKYSVVDLDKKVVLRTNQLDIPVNKLVIGKTVRKI